VSAIMGKHVLHCLAPLTLSAIAGIAAARPPEAPLPDSRSPILLGPYFEILLDRDAKLGFEEIVGAEFKPNSQGVAGFELPADQEVLLEIRYLVLDRIEFYARRAGDQNPPQYRRAAVGDTLPWGPGSRAGPESGTP
jgi:7TMR-DISM extracellular 2